MSQTKPSMNYNDVIRGVAQPSVRAKPMEAVLAKVVRIKEIEPSSSQYTRLQIQVEPIGGTRVFFPAILMRPEMVSFGYFDPQRDYLQNASNDPLISTQQTDAQGRPQTRRDGSPKLYGTSFASVYDMNIMPTVRTKYNKQTGEDEIVLDDGKYGFEGSPIIESTTSLYAATGGTPDLFFSFVARVRAFTEANGTVNRHGYKEITPEQFRTLLNNHIEENNVSEIPQIFVIKQQKEGDTITKNVEVSSYLGALTRASDASVDRWVDRASKNQDIGRQLRKMYAV